MHRLSASALTVLAATGVLACGSDDSDDGDQPSGGSVQQTTAAAAPTKAEYIAASDQACAAQARKSKSTLNELDEAAARQNAGQPILDSLREQSKIWANIAAARNQLTAELQALEPPEGESPDRYLRARDASTAAAEQYSKDLAEAANMPTEQAIEVQREGGERVTAASNRSRRLAEAYGFKKCEQPAK